MEIHELDFDEETQEPRMVGLVPLGNRFSL